MPFAKDALDYLPGDVVEGRYRTTGVLGRGGFGAVYAAEHLGTLQAVALKILTSNDDDPHSVERFYREARITAALTHPNTVRVFDVGRDGDNGALFLAMELLRGPNLEQLMRRLVEENRAMTEAEAIEIAIPVLKSLAEAHAAGLVHRDLKPANIMLASVTAGPPVVKVLDFGCSHTRDSTLTNEGAVMGTPGYMSPEQCRGEDVDMRSDLYAISVILYRCITGRLPFEDTSPMTLLFKHAHQAPPDPCTVTEREIRPETRDMLLRGLAKQPDERFASALDMRKYLESLRKSLPVQPGNPEHLLTDIVAFAMGPRSVRPESAPFEIDDLGDEATRGRTQNYAVRADLNRAQMLMSAVQEPENTQKSVVGLGQPATATSAVQPAGTGAPPIGQALPPKVQRLQRAGIGLGILAVVVGVALGALGGRPAPPQASAAVAPPRPMSPPAAPVAAAVMQPPAPPPATEPQRAQPTAQQLAQALALEAKNADPAQALLLLTQAAALDPNNGEYAEKLAKLRLTAAPATPSVHDEPAKAVRVPNHAPKDRAPPHADKPVVAEQPRGHVQPRLME